MARPVEFDRSEAVDRALRLFWRKGYQASSLTELLAAMGVGRSSFYAAFRDKRSLFVSCLDLFARRSIEVLERTAARQPPLDALQSFVAGDILGADGPQRGWGCLLVNTVVEMADVDDELAAEAGGHLARVQGAFRACLETSGAPPSQAEDLAAMLMLVNKGMRVSSRRAGPEAGPSQSISAIFRLVRSAIADAPVQRVNREVTP